MNAQVFHGPEQISAYPLLVGPRWGEPFVDNPRPFYRQSPKTTSITLGRHEPESRVGIRYGSWGGGCSINLYKGSVKAVGLTLKGEGKLF